MQKIGDITNTADKNGEFTNGNVAAGIAPTLLDAGWFNTVQRELINAVQGAGIKLDNKNDSQLFAAIKRLIDNSAVEIHDASLTQKGIVQLTDVTGSSNTLAATQKLITDVNNNANTKLSKSQNGADIPDKNAFVKNLGLVETVSKANNAVPGSRKVNGKVLTGDVSLNAGDVGAYSKPESDSRFIQLNTNTKTSGYILTKTANYFDDPNSRNLGRSGFLRPNGLDNLGDLAIHIAHPGSDGPSWARGISFSYGNDYGNFDISTYAFDGDGKFKGKKRILTEDDVNTPVGPPIPWPQPNPPSGYLTCNGQAFNKSLYPQLAAAYPSGTLPDLRGEFIRGWDDGRGVDSGRGILSWQPQQVQWHQHIGGHGGRAQGAFGVTNQAGHPGSYNDDSRQTLPFTNNGGDYQGLTNNGAVGNETRPRSVAFNYIVRAA